MASTFSFFVAVILLSQCQFWFMKYVKSFYTHTTSLFSTFHAKLIKIWVIFDQFIFVVESHPPQGVRWF